jgi:hypothetical protein
MGGSTLFWLCDLLVWQRLVFPGSMNDAEGNADASYATMDCSSSNIYLREQN